jgi:hypothetical protein
MTALRGSSPILSPADAKRSLQLASTSAARLDALAKAARREFGRASQEARKLAAGRVGERPRMLEVASVRKLLRASARRAASRR